MIEETKVSLAMLVKTVKDILYVKFYVKTVGYIKDRYRLGHWWVAVMLLNVQSKFLANLLNK